MPETLTTSETALWFAMLGLGKCGPLRRSAIPCAGEAPLPYQAPHHRLNLPLSVGLRSDANGSNGFENDTLDT